MDDTQKPQSKSWLQKLKDESWEAELLVSAIAIFAILKSFVALEWLINYFIDHLEPSEYDFGFYIAVSGYMAIGILAAMFAIHFALRAYWIGLVGLNSVFPDYGLEDSAYSPIYTKKILNVLPKISKSISKIDELCSVIFSAAFAFMLIYLYITVIASLLLILYNMLKDMMPTWLFLIPLVLFGLFMVFGMLISIPANIKRFHTNKTIQHLYFLYARWGAYLFYGPLHKSVLQITMLFGSNFKKKKGLVKMIIFMLLIGVFFGTTKMLNSNLGYLANYSSEQDITKLESSFYANNNLDEKFLLTPQINSSTPSESVIQVFIPVFEHEIALLRETCEIEASENVANKTSEERKRIRKEYLECYQNQNKVFIDNILVRTNFLKTYHSKTDQYGLSGYVNIEHLNKGQHQILIRKTLNDETKKEWRIPFFYGSK